MYSTIRARSVLLVSWILGCRAVNAKGTEALVISPSQYFDGCDGPWSSFFVRVGTPEQSVRVLVSTASPQTMVVHSQYGCSTAAFTTVPDNCAVSRGVLFNPNESSTWNTLGTYGINQDGVGLEANLGYSQRVDFSFETLGIGLVGPSLKNQTVGVIATAQPFYLGVFGLNNQPVNFTSLGNHSSTSFVTTLKDQGVIPSLSWSYTAGAKYRLKQVYGQLIFSGYDTSRFTENQVTFTMAGDYTRDLVVALQSIRYTGTSQTTLLSESILIMIDSTDPNLWLPASVCDAFERAFGLRLDTASGLYLVNDSHHDALLSSNAEVTFRLADVKSGGDAVSITLPYSAFDLTATAPLVAGTSRYFPLKRAANATQYTLGRTFLQEAYLSADYERGVFNVSACKWVEGAKENVVTIPSKNAAANGGPGSGPDGSSPQPAALTGGAIAGIVIGCIAFIAIIALLIVFFCLHRRRKASKYAATDPEPDESVIHGPVFNASYPSSPFGTEPILPSQERSEASPSSGVAAVGPEMSEQSTGNELDGEDTHVKPTTELDGTEIRIVNGLRTRVPNGVLRVSELEGREIEGRDLDVEGTERDEVSTVGTLPSADGTDRDDARWSAVSAPHDYHFGRD